MSSWVEKAKEANAIALEAMQMMATAGQKTGAEQAKIIEEAFKKYQEAWTKSIEAFSEAFRVYSQEQLKGYDQFFVPMQKTLEEAYKRYWQGWKPSSTA